MQGTLPDEQYTSVHACVRARCVRACARACCVCALPEEVDTKVLVTLEERARGQQPQLRIDPEK
jgi:hypothetical protein